MKLNKNHDKYFFCKNWTDKEPEQEQEYIPV